jgi:hypothetical protein
MKKHRKKLRYRPARPKAKAKSPKGKSAGQKVRPKVLPNLAEELNIKLPGLIYNAKNPRTNTLIITALILLSLIFLVCLLFAVKPALITGAATAAGIALWKLVLHWLKGR